MMSRWAKAVAPIAEHVAHVLGQAMAGKYVPVMPLTTRKHRQAQSVVKARKAIARTTATSGTRRQRPANPPAQALWSCPSCGDAVTHRKRIRCDACIATDPGQSTEIRGNRGAAIAARKRALREWEEANPGAAFDPDYFSRDILPKLASVKLADIVEAAGISKSYASTIRAGRYTPHVSTWAALGELVSGGPTGP